MACWITLTAAAGLKGASLDGLAAPGGFLETGAAYISAVSIGAVFFGAMTYIGNGPNFMVKAICDNAKVHTPTFFTYVIRYSIPILLPILALVAWWEFLR